MILNARRIFITDFNRGGDNSDCKYRSNKFHQDWFCLALKQIKPELFKMTQIPSLQLALYPYPVT